MLLFRHHVLKNLLACGRIGQATLDIPDRFHHPGFSAYKGTPVADTDNDAGIVTYDPPSSSRSIPSPMPAEGCARPKTLQA